MTTLIIRAGVIGVTFAYELSLRGDSVTVVDKRSGPAEGTSHANGLLIAPSMSDPGASPGIAKTLIKYLGRETAPFLLRLGALPSLLSWSVSFLRNSRMKVWKNNTRAVWPLAILSRDILDRMTLDLGLRYDRWEHGTLRVHEDAASMRDAELTLAVYRELGCEIRTLDQTGCLELDPALRPIAPEIHGGYQFLVDRSGDCELFTQQLSEICRNRGVKFHYGCKVGRLKLKNERIEGIHTSMGAFEADRYVLAAGSYSLPLAREAGLRLPVYPVKGHSDTLGISGWNGAPNVPFVDNTRKVAEVRMGNRLRVAGTAGVLSLAQLHLPIYSLIPAMALSDGRSPAGRPGSSRSS